MASRGMKGLQLWCKQNTEGYKDVDIKNMSSAWKDGLAFCALIHSFRPDLIDFDSLSKENIHYNNQLAFSIAEEQLDIAAFLDADDMVAMASPDKLSIITYVSQYYNTFHNQQPHAGGQKRSGSVVNNPEILAKKKSLDSTLTKRTKAFEQANICAICNKKVHLVQRFFKDSELYHRTCYRSQSLGKMYQGTTNKQSSPKHNVTEVDNINSKKTVKSARGTAVIKEPSSPKQEVLKDDLNLPSLLDDPDKENHFTKYSSTPSPNQEDKTINSSSLISELPMPKPRSRPTSTVSSTDEQKPPVAKHRAPPVAMPRTPDDMETDKGKYNKVLNPFEDEDLGSSHGTPSLSSDTTEEYDDMHNPFNDAALQQQKTTEEVVEEDKNPFASEEEDGDTGNPFAEEEENEAVGNPFGDDNEEQDDNKGNPFGSEDEAENPFGEEEEESLNPFGDAAEDQDNKNNINKGKHRVTLNKTNSNDIRINPFSDAYDEKSKKTPPPVPPPPRLKKKKAAAPTPPVQSAQPHNTTPPAPSPVIKQSAPPKKAPHTPKKQAAPPVPDWKEKSQKEMAKMNALNINDKKFTSTEDIKDEPTPVACPQAASRLKVNANGHKKTGKSSKASRPAPGHGFPLVKRKVEIAMTEAEIKQELTILDVQLSDLEVKGVKLEELVRFAMEPGAEWTAEDDLLLKDWLNLVQEKDQMVRRETDLVFLMQQQILEQEHADVEFQLRKLLNKPESTKTAEDAVAEEKLLERLVQIVERRNVIINSIEEERVKEEEEDIAYEQLKNMHTHDADKKKKKKKMKAIFKMKRKSKDGSSTSHHNSKPIH